MQALQSETLLASFGTCITKNDIESKEETVFVAFQSFHLSSGLFRSTLYSPWRNDSSKWFFYNSIQIKTAHKIPTWVQDILVHKAKPRKYGNSNRILTSILSFIVIDIFLCILFWCFSDFFFLLLFPRYCWTLYINVHIILRYYCGYDVILSLLLIMITKFYEW